MERAYYDAPRADSYGSVTGLLRQSGKHSKDIRRFLSEQDAYTLHADVRRRFPRRKTLTLGINDLWQADLVDLSCLATSNDGIKYLFTCIDVLSKYGRVAF